MQLKICILGPNIQASEYVSRHNIFAPRAVEVDLANGLAKKGHDITLAIAPGIICNAKQQIEGEAELITGNLDSLKIHARGHVSFEAKLISDALNRNVYELDLIARTIDYCNQNSIDIIVADYPICHFFECFTKVPMVYLLHDPLPPEGTIEYWLYNNFLDHRYISISKSQQRSSLKLNFMGVAYHGIDIEMYSFNDDPQEDLLFMGRMVPEKGLDIAIKTAIELNRHLWIGANISQQTSDYYERVIKPMLSHKQISQPKLYRGEEKIEKYRQAKAFLFPISWEEPFGLVMVEAMACGTPVVAFDCGAVSEIVKDGVTGFVVKPGDVMGFIEAVHNIGKISRGTCRKYVQENFSIAKMVERHEAIYRKIIASS